MKKTIVKSTKMTLAQIKKKYPDKWVGLGDPEYEKDNFTIKKGVVLCNAKTKSSASKKLSTFDNTPHQSFTLLFTGVFEQNYDALTIFSII